MKKEVDEKQMELLRALRDRPCKTKAELQNWIKGFLKMDLPDSTLDLDSNCNPLDMVWMVYKNMVWYNTLPESEKCTKFLFYACRAGFKTYDAAVLELMSMLHDLRGVAHIAAGESHVHHCYNDYFQPLTRLPLVRERIVSSIMEKTILKDDPKVFVEIMPCTKQRVQGPHQSLVIKDEIDVVQNVSAYDDIDGIPVDMPDKRPPITLGISVRKSAYGLVQREIDEAESKGVKVFHWNIIDITERCPDERSGTTSKIYYVKPDSLYPLTEEIYMTLPEGQKESYEPFEGREHCLTNCKIFAACRGLLKNQTSKCKWLKSIEYTQKKLTESKDEQMVIAQFLCRKPPSTGLIYPQYNRSLSEKNYTEMWEIFMREKSDHEITKLELVQLFQKHHIPCYIGVDFGYSPDPCVALVVYIDKMKNIYVVDEFYQYEVTDSELALWMRTHWKALYKPELVYPDIENPGGRRELIKQGFQCAGPKRLKPKATKEGTIENVIKDIKPGISTVRRFLRPPGTIKTKFFISPNACPLTCYEMPRYHNKTDSAGRIIPDCPAGFQPDHGCDTLRYVIHSVLGGDMVTLCLDTSPTPVMGQPMDHAPTPSEVSTIIGVPINVNDHLIEGNDDDDDDENGGGFSFSF